MEVEREREREAEDVVPEDEAARLVEAEDRLREALDDARDDEQPAVANTRIVLDPGPLITGGRRRVIGGGREGDEFVIRLADDGDTIDVGLPWPDDPRDPREPLVRLARARGVDVDRIADIDSVPVVESDDGEIGIIVPPAQRHRDIEVVLPNGRVYSTRIPRPLDLVNRAVMRVGRGLARTRLVPVKAKKRYRNTKWSVSGDPIAFTSIPIGFAGAIALALMTEPNDLAALALGFSTLVLMLGSFALGLLIESELDVY